MMKIFCKIVGDGDTFSVGVDRAKFADAYSVGDLKDVIKKKNEDITVPTRKVQLYMAKKEGGVWLNVADAAALTLDEHGLVQGFEQMDSTLYLKNKKHFGVTFQTGEGQVHVLVVVPKDGVSWITKEEVVENSAHQLSFPTQNRRGGPSTFRTNQSATVEAFFNLLFPDGGEYLPVIFPDALVAHVSANLMPDPNNFCEYFEERYSRDFKAFSEFKRDRVVLIDGAHITYDNELLWLGYLKRTLDGGFPGMRFVLFSSYGSFNVYRKFKCAGIPITIPPRNTFGLNTTKSKPGLQLSLEELEEMVRGLSVSDLIWILSSGHIGIARAILMFLHVKFGSNTPDAGDVELELRSVRLLDNIRSSYWGIPTVAALRK